EGWNSFKKNDAHRKKRSRSLGSTRTDEFVTEVKRKLNEDGNKSYTKLAAEIGCSKQTITNTINKDLGYSSYKKRHRMILTEGTRESRRVKAAALLNNLKHETCGPPAPLTATPSTISFGAWSSTRPTARSQHSRLPQGRYRGGVRQYEEGRHRQGLQPLQAPPRDGRCR
ncbi:Uncharacterized protein FKW44_023129, partial [Caligus rogercresseyi]